MHFDSINTVTNHTFKQLQMLIGSLQPGETLVLFNDFAYVAGAQKEGLVNGNGNEFMPHAKITRQDAAVMVYRFMTKSGFVMQDAELDFADGDYIAGYAKIPVAALKAEALVSGVGNNMFMPVNNLTRAEAAQMIYNTLERGNR